MVNCKCFVFVFFPWQDTADGVGWSCGGVFLLKKTAETVIQYKRNFSYCFVFMFCFYHPVRLYAKTWKSTGHPHNVCVCVTDCYFIANILDHAKYVFKSMLNKSLITLPVVYRRSFASKAVFWAILKDFEFAVYCGF